MTQNNNRQEIFLENNLLKAKVDVTKGLEDKYTDLTAKSTSQILIEKELRSAALSHYFPLKEFTEYLKGLNNDTNEQLVKDFSYHRNYIETILITELPKPIVAKIIKLMEKVVKIFSIDEILNGGMKLIQESSTIAPMQSAMAILSQANTAIMKKNN